MRVVRFGQQKLGVVFGDNIVEATSLLTSMHIELPGTSYPEMIGMLMSLGSQPSGISIDQLDPIPLALSSILCPVWGSMKIICAINNYVAHAHEMRDEVFPKPIFFLKAPSSLTGPSEAILLPRGCQSVEHEIELAVVIGKGGRWISRSAAFDHILGYSAFLDISAREFRSVPPNWYAIKNWDTFAPMGPCLVTKEDIPDPHNLALSLWVNGELRTRSSTSEMIFSIPELIEAASEVCTLEPGDIIATGTPYGVGPIRSGDLITAGVEGIGKMELRVEETAEAPTWHDRAFDRHYREFISRFPTKE